MKYLLAALCFLFFQLVPSSVLADTTNLVSIADTCILLGIPDDNFGATADIIAGTTSFKGPGRGLFRFQTNAIPAGATVSQVTVTFQFLKQNFGAANADFSLHRMLQSWNEGAGTGNAGSVATNGDVTWNFRIVPDVQWSGNVAGGNPDVDFVNNSSATILVTGLGSYTFTSTSALVADVQGWVDHPESNFGWMLKCDDETTTNSRRVGAREDTLNQPVLTVTYSVGAASPQPQITPPVLSGNVIRFSFNAQAGLTYAVEFRPQVDTGNWQTLTNIPAQANPGTIQVNDTVTAGSRFYRVRTP